MLREVSGCERLCSRILHCVSGRDRARDLEKARCETSGFRDHLGFRTHVEWCERDVERQVCCARSSIASKSCDERTLKHPCHN